MIYTQATLAESSGQHYTTDVGSLPFPPPMLTEGLKFVRQCLMWSADVTAEQMITSQTLKPITTYLNQRDVCGKYCGYILLKYKFSGLCIWGLKCIQIAFLSRVLFNL